MAIVLKLGSRISTSSAANPTTITTPRVHGLVTGDSVVISGHSLAGVNGTRTVTVLSTTTFTVPVLGGGTGGRYLATRKLAISGIGGGWTSNGRNTLTGDIISENGAFRPEIDDTVELYEDSTLIFSGVVNKPVERGLGGSPVAHLSTRIECVDFWAFTERLLVTYTFPGGTLTGLLSSLIAVSGITTHYGVTLHPSQEVGPTLTETQWTFRYLNEIFDEVSTMSGGWIGSIDDQRRLRFIKPNFAASPTAPYNIVDDDGNAIGDVEVEIDRDKYANRVWVRCGENAMEETTFGVSVTMPAGTDIGGGLRAFQTDRFAITYTEQPGVIAVGGVNKTIFAPGVRDNGNLPEWYWDWVGGSGTTALTKYPRVIHNDGVYGAIGNGTVLYLESKGPVYYNTVYDILYGPTYTADASYRWYTSNALYARDRSLPVHTIWLNNTTPTPVGSASTPTNEVTGTPWDWVWDDTNKRLGHRLGATPLGISDTIYIYALAPFELLIQYPAASSEPTAEQTNQGLTEILIDAPDVYNEDQGFALAQQYYNIRVVRPKRVVIKTNRAGKILPGQVQDITLSRRNLNGRFFITDVAIQPSGVDTYISRSITVVDNEAYTGSWRDVYLQWGASVRVGGGSSSSSTVVGGGGGGGTVSGGAPVYLLATGIDAQVVVAATWVSASAIRIRVDTATRASLSATVYCRLRRMTGSTTVQARLQNVTDNSPTGVTIGSSSVVNSTSWTTVAFNVNLTTGIKEYELQLLGSVAGDVMQAMAFME
jgi:hypothetical protein